MKKLNHFMIVKRSEKLMPNTHEWIVSTNSAMFIILLLPLLLWQCSKQSNDMAPPKSLKEALQVNTQHLNSAADEISQTYGYKIINIFDNSTLKSAEATDAMLQDSITLAKIKGTYEYQPMSYTHWCFSCFSKLFKKTGESNDLVVKLPEAKVFFPNRFQMVTPRDTSLKNNLIIDASDYHYYFSMGFLWDYKLAASLTINDTAIGTISHSSGRNTSVTFNSSSYAFPNGYSIEVNEKSGDTATSSIALMSNSTILFKEAVNRYKVSGAKYREKAYTLDIGNVEFTKAKGADTLTVSVNGVLQTKAKIEVVDASNSSGSVFSGRDVKITFDDGTSTMLSTLLGPSLTMLNKLTTNLQNVYFATHIVDYIAFNIYKNQTP